MCFRPSFPSKLPPCHKTFQEAQTELNHTAAELNHSAGEVVHSSRGTSSQLAAASGKFSQDFDEFLDAGIEMAGHTQVGSSDTTRRLAWCDSSRSHLFSEEKKKS